MTKMATKQEAETPSGAVPRPIVLRFIGLLRSTAGTARHFPERILHGVRRSNARRDVARAAPIDSALFICHGNVCRSPFAAAVFERSMRELGTPVTVTSAGFIGPGRQPPTPALEAAGRRGLDMTAHRSALVTPQAIHAADLVVVMSADQVTALRTKIGAARGLVLILGDLDPQPIARRTVRDPWGCADSVFDESYDRIERCIADLVHTLATVSNESHPR